mgnify:CR=1 FL=1|tara:strand:+ start:448 stop:573 length:126 start_codon:yes stop_codon:yes gene_type:complete
MTTVKSFEELCKILKEREKNSEQLKQNNQRKKQIKKRIKHG